MSSATKRKHVVKEMLDDYSIPEEHQKIVKVIGSPGSNLHEVVTTDGKKILCSLPVKFRKNIWIKRGDFVVIEAIDEGNRVKAEIVRILYPQHVKSLQKNSHWPAEFSLQSNDNKPKDEDLVKMVEKMDIKEKPSQIPKEDFILSMTEGAKGDVLIDEYYSSDEEDLSDIPANTNRPTVVYEDSDDSECDDDSDGEYD